MFGIMSCHLMLAMRLRQRMWNWSSLRMYRRYGVHASHPYNSVGSTMAQYTLMLVASRTPRSLQRRLVSFPNDPPALPIRAEISSSFNAFCDIVLPKKVNLSTTFSGLLSMVMVGAYSIDGSRCACHRSTTCFYFVLLRRVLHRSTRRSIACIGVQQLKCIGFQELKPILYPVTYIVFSGESEKKCNTKAMSVALVACVVLLLVTTTLLVIQWMRLQSMLKVRLIAIRLSISSQTGATYDWYRYLPITEMVLNVMSIQECDSVMLQLEGITIALFQYCGWTENQ